MRNKKNLRTGYTTGACAAAAAKAATTLLLQNIVPPIHSFPLREDVEIPFPDGSKVRFKVYNSELRTQNSELIACASVIKDAGDDPDVTSGAEIMAEAMIVRKGGSAETQKHEGYTQEISSKLIIKGGKGVGIVTKPGLPVPVGEPAINPVPKRMIKEAVKEVLSLELRVKSDFCLQTPNSQLQTIEVTISVPDGEKLAKKTLNPRLGILGGISILGTTGIVKPVSSSAWTATITSSMDVAKAIGGKEIVLSAGRTSEKAHMKRFNLPEECYVLMGGYIEFSLLEAKRHGFKRIHLCAQWAKMLKIAMAVRWGDGVSPTHPISYKKVADFWGRTTHVRHGAINIKKVVDFLKNLDSVFYVLDSKFNTAREIFDFISSSLATRHLTLFKDVCNSARQYAECITEGIPVITHLVSYDGEIIATSR